MNATVIPTIIMYTYVRTCLGGGSECTDMDMM